jgi:hypothetical protein
MTKTTMKTTKQIMNAPLIPALFIIWGDKCVTSLFLVHEHDSSR